MTNSAELNISNLPILDLDGVAAATNYNKDELASEINKSGVWRVMSGSRGYLDEIEYIGPLTMTSVKIPSKEECVEMLSSEDDVEEVTEYVDEFYGICEQEESVQFSYTEEEFDYYFKVAV